MCFYNYEGEDTPYKKGRNSRTAPSHYINFDWESAEQNPFMWWRWGTGKGVWRGLYDYFSKYCLYGKGRQWGLGHPMCSKSA